MENMNKNKIEAQERTLPIANVGRIMKQMVPASGKISKEGKELMQECVTEFISFVTGEASDKCQKENRKTLNGDDICWALSSLGFDNYAEAITTYLYKYRKAQRDTLVNNRNQNNFMETPINHQPNIIINIYNTQQQQDQQEK